MNHTYCYALSAVKMQGILEKRSVVSAKLFIFAEETGNSSDNTKNLNLPGLIMQKIKKNLSRL